VDDPGGLVQNLDQFHIVADFLSSLAAPASFMVVPRHGEGWRLDRQPEWLAALRQAEAAGHDCQLHGLDHADAEFGPHAEFVRAMNHQDVDESLQWHRDQFGHLWSREQFTERLRIALDIFQQAMGRTPQVLRTGALSMHPEMYEAWADLGGRYVSNHVVDIRGWAYIRGDYDDPGEWDPAIPPHPYWFTDRVIDLPIMSEYAWEMTPEKVEPHLALALEDLDRTVAAGGVFILVCHVQEVGGFELSRDILRRFITQARERYRLVFQTLRDLVHDLDAGTLQAVARPQPDPNSPWRDRYAH
jgi:hypothetical protein